MHFLKVCSELREFSSQLISVLGSDVACPQRVNGDDQADVVVNKLLDHLQSTYLSLNISKPDPLPSFVRLVHTKLSWD